MRALVQRVSHASVTVNNEITGSIDQGLLIFLGVRPEDTAKEAQWLANKVSTLRIFKDENDKMNLSVLDIGGNLLVVSQFTLYASCNMGRRPDFGDAAPPAQAEELYNQFVELLRPQFPDVQTGIFGARMEVSLLNDGPVTLLLDR